jgi:hypothetical protein
MFGILSLDRLLDLCAWPGFARARCGQEILTRVYPSRQRHKRRRLIVVALALLPALAACGGGGGTSGTEPNAGSSSGQAVAGSGFSFQAPEEWTVKVQPTAATARQGDSTVVSVAVLPLVKPYRFALFSRVAKELDRVASTYAANLKGSVTSRRTVEVAGRQSREYEVAHQDLVDRITFVLRGKRNYQLTCRWRSEDGEPAACDQLTATFAFR